MLNASKNMNKQKIKKSILVRRKARVNVKGTESRPRLTVYKSLTSIYAQIIDDNVGKTLVSAKSQELPKAKRTKTESAKEVGLVLAKKAKDKNITHVAFDKGSFKYHGRVKALADGAREGGLDF